MASWVNRMIGAAQLRSATYEEVEADKSATWQALGVVVISAIAAGLSMTEGGGPAIAVGIVAALLGWVLWSAMTWIIGTKILPTPETRADMGELLRTTGFAAAPGVVRLLAAVPIVGFLFNFIAWIWMWAAFVVAVRQALDYRSTWRAVFVCGIGALVYFALFAWTMMLLTGSILGVKALRGEL